MIGSLERMNNLVDGKSSLGIAINRMNRTDLFLIILYTSDVMLRDAVKNYGFH